MDVEYALTLASAASAGAVTAAGQSAWQGLVALGRRAAGRGDDVAAEFEPDPSDQAEVRVFTGRIAERAREDEAFAAELCGWAEEHEVALQVNLRQVHNTVAGSARIGRLVQTGDVHGDVNL
ncbi:hypothetical protein [Streptomyces sp. HNM0574]|uniref:hypothetical protein n=1 Tax=Streptomyces sp. HNM0574 TaxID=2714954 RepID=UPI00146B8B27|nr:hypothetical protein [Streptomyces sp. HNM0574]NLU67532.1 hypothetical protein [Streptomyces sp. HNM0574]